MSSIFLSHSNEGIDDMNVRYNTKMEGYMIFMSYMKELYAIMSKRWEK